MKYPLIDLLRLHHPDDSEKSALRAYGENSLNELFNELCISYTEYKSIKIEKLAQQFSVNKNSIQNWRGLNKKYKNGHPIPLWVLEKILVLNNSRYGARHREIINTISHLQCGRTAQKVKAVKYLIEDFARICGAHAADGSLYHLKDRGPITAIWEIGDQEKSNILAVHEWTSNLFGTDLEIKYNGKMCYLRSNLQIFSRYLNRIFDFPLGSKSDIVKEPKILSGYDDRLLSSMTEEISKKMRLEFAKEVLNFDGHSTITGGIVSVGLGCNSPYLRNSVVEIFDKNGIHFKNYHTSKKILTTRKVDSNGIYNLGVFRGNKRNKMKRQLAHP